MLVQSPSESRLKVHCNSSQFEVLIISPYISCLCVFGMGTCFRTKVLHLPNKITYRGHFINQLFDLAINTLLHKLSRRVNLPG